MGLDVGFMTGVGDRFDLGVTGIVGIAVVVVVAVEPDCAVLAMLCRSTVGSFCCMRVGARS